VPTSKRERWSRDQLLIAFNLYCRLPFGRLHSRHPDVIRAAELIGRSPDALAMKLVNFASLDPQHVARGVRGLNNVSRADRDMWREFSGNWEALAYESETAWRALLTGQDHGREGEEWEAPEGVTEKVMSTRVRVVQGFFRRTVLAAYEYRCACCRLSIQQMLNASHIIPWRVDKQRRADPTNGIAMCAFHDRAFDRGLITLDGDRRIVVSREVPTKSRVAMHRVGLIELAGARAAAPSRFAPDEAALEYHRENIFTGG